VRFLRSGDRHRASHQKSERNQRLPQRFDRVSESSRCPPYARLRAVHPA
jgi:hypothetical protein